MKKTGGERRRTGRNGKAPQDPESPVIPVPLLLLNMPGGKGVASWHRGARPRSWHHGIESITPGRRVEKLLRCMVTRRTETTESYRFLTGSNPLVRDVTRGEDERNEWNELGGWV